MPSALKLYIYLGVWFVLQRLTLISDFVIRALKALTGKDFTARTRSKLTDDEKHFLRLDNRGHVLFFGTWMSRDSL